jgi:hypothetical protein
MKPLRSVLLGPLIAPLFVLARRGRDFEVIAFVFMFATIFLLLLERLRPKVQLRKKPLPKPDIRLNINGPSSRTSATDSRLAALRVQTLQ